MRILRNMIILVAVLIATTDISLAKKYTLVPNDTIVINGMLEDLQTLSIQQQNISKDTINLQWKKVKADLPDNWEASVCDNSFCYTSLIDSGSMIPIFPDDYGLLLLHITPKINYGESIIQYTVWDANFPNEIDTLTYILQVFPTSIVNSNIVNINIFPNPSNDIINISNNTNQNYVYSLIDMNSKLVLSGDLTSNINIISIQNLSAGLYFLEIKDKKGKLQIAKSIIKN